MVRQHKQVSGTKQAKPKTTWRDVTTNIKRTWRARQPDRAYAHTNETKRSPVWVPPNLRSTSNLARALALKFLSSLNNSYYDGIPSSPPSACRLYGQAWGRPWGHIYIYMYIVSEPGFFLGDTILLKFCLSLWFRNIKEQFKTSNKCFGETLDSMLGLRIPLRNVSKNSRFQFISGVLGIGKLEMSVAS